MSDFSVGKGFRSGADGSYFCICMSVSKRKVGSVQTFWVVWCCIFLHPTKHFFNLSKKWGVSVRKSTNWFLYTRHGVWNKQFKSRNFDIKSPLNTTQHKNHHHLSPLEVSELELEDLESFKARLQYIQVQLDQFESKTTCCSFLGGFKERNDFRVFRDRRFWEDDDFPEVNCVFFCLFCFFLLLKDIYIYISETFTTW